jgi:BON domain
MKRPWLTRIVPQALALTSVLIFAGREGWAQQDPGQTQEAAQATGQRSDGQIEMDVVKALDDSQALKNDMITAATIQSQVTLSGTVASDASKQLAESIVSKVPGVTKVNNHLAVGNPADAQNDQSAQPAPETYPDPNDDGAPQSAQNQNPPQYAPNGQENAPPQYPQQPNEQPQPGYPPPAYPPPTYGQQPGYPPPPPGYSQRYPYPPTPPPAPRYSIPNGPITLTQGTILQVRTTNALDNKHAQEGTPLDFTVIGDVTVNGWLAIPRGATVHGLVTESKNAGQLKGSPELALRLTSLELGGKTYPLDSDEFRVKGPGKGAHTAGNIIGGALVGALIGGAFGGGGGAAIGAAAGGTAGTAASAAMPGPNAWIPAEALVTFHLNAPVTVQPVSQQEAARLAQGLYPGGPNLYRRPYPYYARPYGPAVYAYPPPVYYRPYYMAGGYYYWR